MKKVKFLIFVFTFGLFMLTACDNSKVVDSTVDSSEISNDSFEDITDNQSTGDSSQKTTEEDEQSKVKNDGTLDDGIEWGPLE